MSVADIKLNIRNYSRCLCPVCPVQRKSDCTASKREGWLEIRRSVGRVLKQYHLDPGSYDLGMSDLEQSETGNSQGFRKPAPGEMIEVYCSDEVGRSACDDLSGDQPCQCPDCAVWSDNSLNEKYYCLEAGPR